MRDERLSRRWPIRELAARAGVSAAVAYRVETGEPTSLDAVFRVATALGLRPEFELVDARRRDQASRPLRTADLVHSAMGELEAAHLRRIGFPVGIDEPYQHYQFAGRADVVAWDLEQRALLHTENWTRFPDFQETAGAYNAKRAYLEAALAQRLGIPRWRSETHVIAALWSAEVLHALRMRPQSFHSLCPDPAYAFTAWWTGAPPATGSSSTLVVLDPLARPRQRAWIGLEEAIERARPRHRGYAAAAQQLLADGPQPE